MKLAVFSMCVILAIFKLESAESPLHVISDAEFYSQAHQDKMVSTILYGFLGKQDQGFYLEIGAGDPIHINNSYYFEKNFRWKGTSIDISQDLADQWYAVRKNLLLSENAITSDYRAILDSFPHVLDYLSLDIDGHYVDVLKNLPFDQYIFKIITIEHDFYRFGTLYRDDERCILQSLGYHLLCSDVSQTGLSFEDWWVHPSFFSSSQWAAITSLDLKAKDCNELIQILQDALTTFQKDNL